MSDVPRETYQHPDKSIDWLKKVLLENGITVSDRQMMQLDAYASWLKTTNQGINLVSRKDESSIISKHVLHSLSPLMLYPHFSYSSILDAGTGGGLPGIPLSIMTGAKTILLDSIQKKIEALQHFLKNQSLKNISAVRYRLEDYLAKPGITFQCITFRGVSSVENILEWTYPYWSRHSVIMLLYKGGDLEEDLSFVEKRLGKRLKRLSCDAIDFNGSSFIGEDKSIIRIEI